MVIQDWAEIITISLQQVWQDFIVFLPNVIAAVITFIVGWVIAIALGKIVSELVKSIRIDQLLVKLGAEKPLSRAGLRLDSGMFIGGLVKWFLIIAFLLAASDILGLSQVSGFLRDILTYLPNVIIATVILLLGVMLSNFLARLVISSISAAGLTSSNFLGTVTRWSIMIFAVFAALIQLGIAPSLINTIFTGIIAMLAIAGGIAFGLGGKEQASDFISRLRSNIAERR